MSKQTNGVHVENNLLVLADSIARQTKDLAEYFESHNHVLPTFEPGCVEPPDSPEYLKLQRSLKSSLEDLELLIDGPRRHLRSLCCQGYELGAYQVALEFELFTLVPAEGEIALKDLAERAGLDLDRTSRIVRLLITFRFFKESRPGFISHSSLSHILHEDEELRCTVHYSLDEMLKAASASADSLKGLPHESDSSHCPFMTRHGLPIFNYYAQDPRRAGRFAKAMTGAAKMDLHIDELRDQYPWQNLQGRVVDIGGGNGHISKALAELLPELQFVVQDGSAEMLAQGEASLKDELRGRVSFMQHNFFKPEPLTDAGAYVMRQCTHNWCDRDVVTMFKGVVPGLEGSKAGTPFLINDIVMPEPGEWSRHAERGARQIDMIMLVGFGAKQRTKTEFEQLLKEADPRYEIRKVYADGPLGLLEVNLRQ